MWHRMCSNVGKHKHEFNVCKRHNSLENLKNVGNYFHNIIYAKTFVRKVFKFLKTKAESGLD